MKMTKWIVLSALCMMLHLDVLAQDEEDRKYVRKRPNENAINTKQETPVKIIDYIVGTWQIEQVLQDKKDVSENYTLDNQNRTIIFTREKKYISYTGEEQIDSGRYRVNEQHGFLYLESDDGDNLTEWAISFPGDDLLAIQLREEGQQAQKYKYIYKRQPGN